MEPSYEHFSSITWCLPLLSDPAWALTPTFSRQPKPSSEDSLIAETLNSSSTIPHCLSLYLIPAPGGDGFITAVRTLMTLSSGMNGGTNALHGGIIATLMDDVIGTLLTVNKESKDDGKGDEPLTQSTVTASMNVKYLRLVRTPGTVLVEARVRERKGRKFWIDGVLKDGQGRELAKCESLWIRVGGKL